MNQKRAKKLIKRYTAWWTQWLGLRYQTVITAYVEQWEGNPNTYAICDTNWRYMESTISFNMPKVINLNEDELESVVVHELMHIFLNEMREEGIDHEERCATQLQKAFMWVRGADK